MVAMLLFNMVAPIAMANNNDTTNVALLCTSAGLIEVVITDSDQENSLNANLQSHSFADHCPFCNLSSLDFSLNTNKPIYPAPETNLALNYLSVPSPSPAKVIIKHALMRAPPVSYL